MKGFGGGEFKVGLGTSGESGFETTKAVTTSREHL